MDHDISWSTVCLHMRFGAKNISAAKTNLYFTNEFGHEIILLDQNYSKIQHIILLCDYQPKI